MIAELAEHALTRRSTGLLAAPVRQVHLGLGNFFRAHQAYYSASSADADQWGIAAFGGRGGELAATMDRQDGLYTLVTKSSDGDRFDVIGSVSEAHPAAAHDVWLGHLRSPDCSVVTLTVTEAAYLRADGGGLARDHRLVRADTEILRGAVDAPPVTIPGRLVSGLDARRRADAGPIAVVPCDNVMHNGAVLARLVAELAHDIDPALADWIDAQVSFVDTVADRITPRTDAEHVRSVRRSTGILDKCPVATEPFAEWVLRGDFPAGRPGWETAGARFVDDIEPFERRKLWLLNGAHSLLAYGGTLRGHSTVAEAMADETCRSWVDEWWDDAGRHLDIPAAHVAAYRQQLLERFANAAIVHRLDQIAADGSLKIPVRVLDVLVLEREAGRLPLGATRLLAAWILHLRGGSTIDDRHSGSLVELAAGPLSRAVPRLLAFLEPTVGADAAVTTTVLAQAEELAHA